MQPMDTFDPVQPCDLHDDLNDDWFAWPIKDRPTVPSVR
jgi:hypothetical protein